MNPITKSLVTASFAKEHEVALIPFRKGQRKDDAVKDQLRHFDKPEGVVFIATMREPRTATYSVPRLNHHSTR